MKLYMEFKISFIISAELTSFDNTVNATPPLPFHPGLSVYNFRILDNFLRKILEYWLGPVVFSFFNNLICNIFLALDVECIQVC